MPAAFPSLDVLSERLRQFSRAEPLEDIALAAVATIVRAGADGPEVLFIERAVRDGDPWSGDVAFPGGKLDNIDVSLRATAMRETLEELGLALPESAFVARLDDVFGRTNGYRVAQFVFVVQGDVQLVSNAEVASFFWTPLATLTRPELVETITIQRMNFTFEVPCIRLGAHVLWGMTFRMTNALAEAMRFGERERESEP
ncbi:MAG: CoA pyrophosphatase [Polyangiaceae bacterium]